MTRDIACVIVVIVIVININIVIVLSLTNLGRSAVAELRHIVIWLGLPYWGMTPNPLVHFLQIFRERYLPGRRPRCS
jgi:hypothetical protein